jgi:hypothetical protein
MNSFLICLFNAKDRVQQAVATVVYHLRRRRLMNELDDLRDNIETCEHQQAILPAEERTYRLQFKATRDRILALDQEHDRSKADMLSRFAP